MTWVSRTLRIAVRKYRLTPCRTRCYALSDVTWGMTMSTIQALHTTGTEREPTETAGRVRAAVAARCTVYQWQCVIKL